MRSRDPHRRTQSNIEHGDVRAAATLLRQCEAGHDCSINHLPRRPISWTGSLFDVALAPNTSASDTTISTNKRSGQTHTEPEHRANDPAPSLAENATIERYLASRRTSDHMLEIIETAVRGGNTMLESSSGQAVEEPSALRLSSDEAMALMSIAFEESPSDGLSSATTTTEVTPVSRSRKATTRPERARGDRYGRQRRPERSSRWLRSEFTRRPPSASRSVVQKPSMTSFRYKPAHGRRCHDESDLEGVSVGQLEELEALQLQQHLLLQQQAALAMQEQMLTGMPTATPQSPPPPPYPHSLVTDTISSAGGGTVPPLYHAPPRG